MEKDQLLTLASQLVDIKVPFADSEYKKQLAEEVREKIEETINLELLSNLNIEQTDEYRDLLSRETTTDEEILTFIKNNNIDVDALTATALTKFRVAYLGA